MSAHIIQLGDLYPDNLQTLLERHGELRLEEQEDGSVKVWAIHQHLSAQQIEHILLERRAQAAYDAVMNGGRGAELKDHLRVYETADGRGSE